MPTADRRKRKPTEPNAEVFTPPHVVSYMLAAIQTRRVRLLSHRDRILEPSAGDGAFVRPIVRQIAASFTETGLPWSDTSLDGSLRAFEVNPGLAAKLRAAVAEELSSAGCSPDRTAELVSLWIREEDFLGAELTSTFNVVVGNPPYVRYDAIPDGKVRAYQRDYSSFRGRCDLYVPFIQRSLSLLSPDGVFCFICSNRFAKNDYGLRLRAFIAASYHVALYLNIEHADVFGKDVAAYPAILMVDRDRGAPTFAASVRDLSATPLSALAYGSSPVLARFPEWYAGDDPWFTTDVGAWNFARQMKRSIPLLADSAAGTRFGIGVATGNDAVFVRSGPERGIEPDCLLPLATGDDVRAGRVHGPSVLVNPFRPDDSGKLRVPGERPGLDRYFERNRAALETRFVARKREWYRTIDRVSWALFKTPKILLPDIQSGGIVGLDATGSVYPHHNLYWIASKGWPLPVLAAILRSSFVTRQIRESSSEMRGGSIRYQAKNLERLRIPPVSSVKPQEAALLAAAYSRGDLQTIDRTVDAIVARCLMNSTEMHYLQNEPEQLLFAMEPPAEYDTGKARKRVGSAKKAESRKPTRKTK